MKKIKSCFKCSELSDKLFRCRYNHAKEWVFLCQKCLSNVKRDYRKTYQYGGTWKSTN